MIIQAAQAHLAIAETPITYAARPEGSRSKLRSVPDGLRHVRFMLACTSAALIWVPAAVARRARRCADRRSPTDLARRRRRRCSSGSAGMLAQAALMVRAYRLLLFDRPRRSGAWRLAAAAGRARRRGARRGDDHGRGGGPARPAPASGDDPPRSTTTGCDVRHGQPPSRAGSSQLIGAPPAVRRAARRGCRAAHRSSSSPTGRRCFFYGDSLAYLANAVPPLAGVDPPGRLPGVPAGRARRPRPRARPRRPARSRPRHRRARVRAHPPARVPGAVAGSIAAAPVLFDAYELNLEQHVLSEALFTLLVVAALVVLLWRSRPSLAACIAAGHPARRGGAHPLGGPRADRPRARRSRSSAAGSCARSCSPPPSPCPLRRLRDLVQHRPHGSFALTDHDGYFLYGRVADFAELLGACRSAR